MIGEWWIGRDLKRSSRALIWGKLLTFTWWDSGSQCPNCDSNQSLPDGVTAWAILLGNDVISNPDTPEYGVAETQQSVFTQLNILWRSIIILLSSLIDLSQEAMLLTCAGFQSRMWHYLVCWRVLSSVMQRRVVRWKSTDVSEEYLASICKVEE
jgi:hypothetical protein